MAARRDSRGPRGRPRPRRGSPRRDLDQPRLADAGLTLDEHEAAVRRRRPPRRNGWRRARSRGRPAARSRARRPRRDPRPAPTASAARPPGPGRSPRHPVLADRVVQVGRLVQRRHAELPVEQRDELPVLPDGTGAVAGPREQLDEPPLPDLVERIELDPPPAASTAPARHRRHRCGRPPAVRAGPRPSARHGGACRLPVVEGRAVAKREAGQERAAGQARGRLEVRDRPGSREPLEIDEVDDRPRPRRARPGSGR